MGNSRQGVSLVYQSKIYQHGIDLLERSRTFQATLYQPQGHRRVRLDEELDDQKTVCMADKNGLEESRGR